MHQSIILLACGVEQNSRDSEGWGDAGRRNNARVAKRGYPFQIAFIIWEALPTLFCREVSKSGIVHIEQAPEIGCQTQPSLVRSRPGALLQEPALSEPRTQRDGVDAS